MTNRRRISGRLQRGPRGLAVVTNEGDLWVLDAYEPVDGELDTDVVVEGTVVGLDRLHVDWVGAVAA